MNRKILTFSLLLCITAVLYAQVFTVDIESKGMIVKCDREDSILVRHVFLNVSDNNAKFSVTPLEFSASETIERQSPVMYRHEFVKMGRQTVLHIMLYPFYSSGKTYVSKYRIELLSSKPVMKSDRDNPLLVTSLNSAFVTPSPKAAPPELQMTSFLMFETDSAGIYRIDYDMLKDADVTPELLNPNKMALYTSDKTMLSVDNPSVESFLHPVRESMRFIGDDDMSFEKDEYLLFYAEPVYGDSINMYNGTDMYNNPYTDKNVYMLDLNAEPLAAYAPEMSNLEGDSIVYAWRIFHYDSINPAEVGYNWAWHRFEMLYDTVYKTFEYPFSLKSFADSLCTVGFTFFYETADTFSFYLYMNDSIIAEIGYMGFDRVNPSTYAFNAENLRRDNTVKVLARNTDNSIKRSYLTDIRIKYRPDINNIYEPVTIYDPPALMQFRNDDEQYIYIKADRDYLGVLPAGTDASVRTHEAEFVFLDSKIRKPQSMRYVDISNTLNNTTGADILVITGDGMGASALKYKAYREKQGYSVRIYEMNELYEAFTLGFPHPVAIKALAWYALNYWDNAPEYMLLLGSGSFDYKNRLNTFEDRNVVPVYETGFYMYQTSLPGNEYFYTDRWFCTVMGEDDFIDIAPGRITVMDADEAGYALQKIMDYETKSDDFARSRVMILADDEYSNRTTEYFTEFQFTQYSEDLSQFLAESYAYDKLFLMDYPGDKQPLTDWEHWPDDPGEKRQLTAVFNDILSRGVDFGFFYGHGSYSTITHEHILLYPEDITAFSNTYRYPVFLFGTCNAGQADSDKGCIAGDFQKLPFSGFSASIAATRSTFTTENISVLERSFADDLLHRELSTMGQYYMSMINYHFNEARSHQLYGDPAMFTGSRDYSISISENDTFSAGSYAEYVIHFPEHISGEMVFTAYQPEFRDSHDYYHVEPYRYVKWYNNDGIMFTGRYDVNGDSAVVRFPLPDTFALRTYTGRISSNVIVNAGTMYIDNDNTNYIDFSGTSQFSPDSGEISISVNGIELKEGAFLPAEYTLEIGFTDSSGVYQGNIDAYNPSLSVNRQDYPLDAFTYSGDSYQLEQKITSSSREDTINIRIFNNALAQSRISVIVKHVTGTKRADQYTLYPNPAHDKVNVSFIANGAGYGKFTVISREGGVLISEEKLFTEGFNTFSIKLKDFYNRELSPGIYILRANLRFYDRKDTVTEDRKLIKTE